MERLTGFLSSEVVGKRIFDVFPLINKSGEKSYYEQALRGKSSVLTGWPFVMPNTQEQRFIETYFSPLRDRAEKIIGGLGIVRDITDYEVAKENAVAAENRFRSLIGAADDVIFTLSLDGHFTLLNPAWERVTGWTAQEGLNMRFNDVLHPDSQLAALEAFQVLLRGRDIKPIENRIQRKDGQFRVVETNARALINRGQVVGVLGVSRDITDRKEAEAGLRTWANIFENVNVGIKIVDVDGKTVKLVNPAYAVMHGYSQQELVDTQNSQHYSKEAFAEFPKHNAILKKNGYHAFESEHRRKDGTIFPVSVEATIVRDAGGKGMYRAVLVRDITSRRELEEKLQEYTKDLEKKVVERTLELERRLRKEAQEKVKDEALLSSIGEGVIVTDEKAMVTFINHQTEVLLGWHPETVLGKDIFSLLVVRDKNRRTLPYARCAIGEALKSGKRITNSSYYYVNSDGTEFPVAITSSPVILDQKVIGAITVFRDITKEKEVDRVKSEFVSLASHQLRTPLSTINWYAETLLKGKGEVVSDRQKNYIDQIYGASRRMVKLVHDLLNVSRLELGTFGLEPEPIKLGKFMHEMIEEMTVQIKERKLKIVERYDRSVPTAPIDRQWAHTVFQNILTNAIKYTPPGGTITVEVVYWGTGCIPWAPEGAPCGPLILCAITDTGYGIPKEDQSKVFTKFFRADNVKEQEQDGTGLGLYMVKSLLALVKGAIWFESPGRPLSGEGIGKRRKGTTFYVSIPVPAKKLFWQ